MDNKEGPQVITYPLVKLQVCTGCKFLHKQAGMRGHKTCTDNYSCTHTVFNGETLGNQPGRTIAFNHEGDCITPSWCPFLTCPKCGAPMEDPFSWAKHDVNNCGNKKAVANSSEA